MLGVHGARANDSLQLSIGEAALDHEVFGEHRAVVALGSRGRSHRRRLDEARRVGTRSLYLDARAIGVEHRCGERARGRGLHIRFDRQRLGGREWPRKHRFQTLRDERLLAREGGAERRDAGREEGEEVELLNVGWSRLGSNVRCRRGHGISGWHGVRSHGPRTLLEGLRPAAVTGSPIGPASRQAMLATPLSSVSCQTSSLNPFDSRLATFHHRSFPARSTGRRVRARPRPRPRSQRQPLRGLWRRCTCFP